MRRVTTKKENRSMKRLGVDQLGKASRVMTVGVLLVGLVGCQGLPGSELANGIIKISKGLPDVIENWRNPPIHVSQQCLSVDVGKELWSVYHEAATVESAIDRLNTAARLVEIGGLITRTLPISGGSDWPQKVNGMVPLAEEAKLRQLLQLDPVYASGVVRQTSALKLKEMYLQTALFNRYPELSAPRKLGVATPSEGDVKALATKVLGPGYSPAFTKVFYRFLQYNPAFEPKAELFAGRLEGKATEVYPSLLDAVVSLGENKSEIKQLQDSVLQAEEKNAKERRDILDLTQRIKKLESAEFGNPSTADEAVQASEKETNTKQVDDLRGQLAVQEEEFKTTVKDYKEELEQLGIEMAKIKTQMGAFDPEQRALAANIETVVHAAHGAMCQSEVLAATAGYHLKKVLPKWKDEVKVIAGQGGPVANERIRRITVNLTTLPSNLAVLMTEIGVLDGETKIFDGLFKGQVSVDTSEGTTTGGISGALRRGLLGN